MMLERLYFTSEKRQTMGVWRQKYRLYSPKLRQMQVPFVPVTKWPASPGLPSPPAPYKRPRLHENVDAAELLLTPDDLMHLEQAINQLAIQGERYPY